MGALFGALIGTLVTFAVLAEDGDQPDGATALVVFDREARSVDDPANLVSPIEDLLRGAEGTLVSPDDRLELRWVGSPEDLEVYAVRWRQDEFVNVCLLVESADGAATAECASESDFAHNGLRMTAFGLDLKWGPTGTEVWVSSFR
ncbi:hypothetical protein [Pseudolysinimonas yzui]|uniref:hypothetical protein n=1 Tax=Pseudolysinimonas yzui TaxID=2708254 RepID=UPI00174B7053|nr:hypothetical protein [Pseudolysinimonas yzui]